MHIQTNCFGVSLTTEVHHLLQDNIAAIFNNYSDAVSVSISSILDIVKHTLPASITNNGLDVPRLIQLAQNTTPDFTIGDIFSRWHLLPSVDDQYGIYLHHLLDEDKRWPHDHPWNFISLVIEGQYDEFVLQKSVEKNPIFKKITRTNQDEGIFRSSTTTHFTEVTDVDGAWSIILREPVSRLWGFHTDKQWMEWSKYVDSDLYSIIEGEIKRRPPTILE